MQAVEDAHLTSPPPASLASAILALALAARIAESASNIDDKFDKSFILVFLV